MDNLNLKPGQWLYTSCGEMPGSTCQLTILAPSDQKEDLIVAAMAHAVQTHKYQDGPELRQETEKMIKNIEIK